MVDKTFFKGIPFKILNFLFVKFINLQKIIIIIII